MLIGEQLLLLHLKDRGSIPMGGKGLSLKKVLPAAVLEDLRIMGKIEFNLRKKKIYFNLVDTSPTGNSILDSALEIIKNTPKKFQVKKWIETLSKKMKHVEDQMWEDLEKQGVIENRKRKHVLVRPEVKEKLIEELKEVIIEGKELNGQQFGVLSILANTLNLKLVAKRSERNNKYCKEIKKSNIVAKILRQILVGKMQKIGSVAMGFAHTVQASSQQLVSDVSGISSDFTNVTLGAKSWSEIHRDKVLRGGKSLVGNPIGGSTGDALLKGVKGLKEKISERKDEKKSEEIDLNI
ncbi:MAG: GPP34 family phosphoprotein [Promethearchaeota archaeon]